MSELENYIKTYFGISNDQLLKISTFFKPLILRKGEYFLKAGRQSNRLGFVQSGILREFVIRDQKEVTKWISTKGYFAVDLSGFVFGNPARWNIQALTDTELYVIEEKDYRDIGKVVPDWTAL